MKIFLNPYRVVFLYPQYQKIVSASNLLGFVIGLCVLYQIGYRLAANLHITPTEPLFAAPEEPVWCFYMALCFPLSLYVGMWVCAWLSALALKWKDPAFTWQQCVPYVFLHRYPTQWFAQRPSF